MKIFFDGGCRPNPGSMELAVVAIGKAYLRADAGQGTNQDAEWSALLFALEIAASIGAMDVQILGDSATVVHQASGKWPCRNARSLVHLGRFKAAACAFDRVRVRHIGRAQNLAGIALEKGWPLRG